MSDFKLINDESDKSSSEQMTPISRKNSTSSSISLTSASSIMSGDLASNNSESNEELYLEMDINQRRKIVVELLKENEELAKEGDKIYVIPKFWYDNFFNEDIDSNDMLRPIDISLICQDYDNFLLKDYDQCPYVPIAEKIFNKFVDWYGLAKGSKPTFTYLIKDEKTNNLVTEFNKCFFRVQYLIAPDNTSMSISNRHVDNINYFSVSTLSVMSEVLQKVLDFFFKIESDLDIESTDFKIWLTPFSANGSTNIRSKYLLTPLEFLSLDPIQRLKSDTFSESLRALNISNGSFIIEIEQSNKNYHWVSNYFKYNQLISSNGQIGLRNLGNTCYMNSALQCLVHIPQLRDYFFYNIYELEVNRDNPLGYQGNVAKEFHDLIQNLFSDSLQQRYSFAPNHFKTVIGHCNAMFSSYSQQDSQEFLAFLLDGLHEDLNRIKQKPYVEKPSLSKDDNINDFSVIESLAKKTWDAHLLRNDSIITDLFVGMYKSTLQCLECNTTSITFDPYNDITLPLPVNQMWSSKVRIFPQNLPPCIVEVELPKSSSYEDLKAYVANCVDMKVEDLHGCEIFNHQIYNNFESNDSNSRCLPLPELISDTDVIIFYELPTERDDIIIPVYNTCISNGYKSPSLFGIPFFLILNQGEINNITLIRRKLERCYTNLSGGFIPFESSNFTGELTASDFPLLKELHPKTDFSQYEELIKYAIPTSEPSKIFFDIKLFKDHPVDSDSKEDSPEFWSPRPHMNFNNAVNISENRNPIIKDIYNYQNLVNNNIQIKENTQQNQSMSVDVMNPELGTSLFKSVEEGSNSKETTSEKNLAITTESDANNDSADESVTTGESLNIDLLDQISENGDETIYNYLDRGTFLVCEWSESGITTAFSKDKVINWEHPGEIPNEELLSKQSTNVNKSITLNDCLNLFSKKEVLSPNDPWYCPNCKEHRQASKTIQLWNTPDIMLVHLKRFESTRSFSDKIDVTVEFPINELNIEEHVVCKTDPRGYIYDLIAVDNHYGGLGGGHYTAYVKNFVDNNWYYFDDSRVTVTSPEQSIAGSAYLLFYLRRGSIDNNTNDTISSALNNARLEYKAKNEKLLAHQEELYEINKTEVESGMESESMSISSEREETAAVLAEEDNQSIELHDAENKTDNITEDPVTENVAPTSMDSEDFQLVANSCQKIPSTTSADSSSRELSSTYSIEVGHLDINDVIEDNSENISRRKMRLVKKVYSNELEDGLQYQNEIAVSNPASNTSGSRDTKIVETSMEVDDSKEREDTLEKQL